LGGDTAGEGSDFYAAKVVNAVTGATAATLHIQQTDDDLYARQIYCLGHYYHDAMVAIEVNYSLAPTRLLQKWGYPNLYMRERLDTLTGKCALRAGFCTNAQTRPVVLANLKALWRDNHSIERDRETLLEMLSFVKNALGRPEAARGKHDDLVMSLAIAHHVAECVGREWVTDRDVGNDWISAHFHCLEDDTR
jgi:phage terminase large subunit